MMEAIADQLEALPELLRRQQALRTELAAARHELEAWQAHSNRDIAGQVQGFLENNPFVAK